MTDWDIDVGETLARRDLHDRWGGAWYGGIEPAPRAGSVFVFTSPDSGKAFGYDYDGWSSNGTFHYTGDGQVGDQLASAGGNKSLLDAASLNRSIRAFRANGTQVTYLGEFELHGDRPFVVAESTDRNGELRSVLVFRLVPIGPVLRDHEVAADGAVEIPLEAGDAESYAQSRLDEPVNAVRREAALVRDYEQWLIRAGRVAVRHRVPLPDGRALYTDCFDKTTGELIEAKGSASRTYVRHGLGQLLDYCRFVAHERRALLFPTRPADDLVELLTSHRVGVIWPEGSTFRRIDSP